MAVRTAVHVSQIRYSYPAIVLHWLVFLLVALALFAVEMRGPHGSPSRAWWMGIHVWAGSLVGVMMIPRLAWRLYRGVPPPITGRTEIWSRGARGLHRLFYVVLILQPLLGILMANFSAKPVRFLGTNWSFILVNPNPELAQTLHTAHVLLGNTLYYLIGIHILAALWQQFILRNGLLRRML